MTGYALASAEHPHGALSLELRSVNARFFDLQFRVPDELRGLEPLLREAIAARVTRGKVDCRLSYTAGAGAGQALDAAALDALRELEAAA
ncbi:MAG: YicC/YloC family endoribonuclease, partial [Burkholderiales bacterium]